MNQNTNEDCAINLSQRPSAATTPTDDSTSQSVFLVSDMRRQYIEHIYFL